MSLHLTEQEFSLCTDLLNKLDVFTLAITGNKIFRKMKEGQSEQARDYAISKACRNKWSTNHSVIDSFVRMNADLSQEEKELVLSWKKCLPGEYVYIQDTENYSVFFSKTHHAFYAVKGLARAIGSVIKPGYFVQACFLPYNGGIIWDDTTLFTQFEFTPAALEHHKNLANEAIKNGEIITQLGNTPHNPERYLQYLIKRYESASK